jgi:hypothetical protein
VKRLLNLSRSKIQPLQGFDPRLLREKYAAHRAQRLHTDANGLKKQTTDEQRPEEVQQ